MKFWPWLEFLLAVLWLAYHFMRRFPAPQNFSLRKKQRDDVYLCFETIGMNCVFATPSILLRAVRYDQQFDRRIPLVQGLPAYGNQQRLVFGFKVAR